MRTEKIWGSKRPERALHPSNRKQDTYLQKPASASMAHFESQDERFRWRKVMTKDQVSTARDSDCEDRASRMEYWQDALQSRARILEILGSLRFVPRLVQPLEGTVDFDQVVREFEICLIKLALHQTAGKQKKAAHLLNLKPTTLHEKLKTYGLVKEIRWQKLT